MLENRVFGQAGGANNKTINSAYAVACEKIGGIPDGICYA